MKPRSCALTVASSWRPMLVGDVRIATTGAGILLEVVGREPVGLLGDEPVEEAPVQQRVAHAPAAAAAARQPPLAAHGGRAERVRDRRATPARARPAAATASGERPGRRRRRRAGAHATRPRPATAAASATAGHIARQTAPAASASRRARSATRSATRAGAGAMTSMRHSVRTIASAETHAWCGRNDDRQRRPAAALVTASRPTAA